DAGAGEEHAGADHARSRAGGAVRADRAYGGWAGGVIAFRLARRELRGGVAGLRIVLACLALGVAAIAAVGTLRAAIAEGLGRDGSRILGGDIEVNGGAQPLPDTVRDWLRGHGARISDVVTMRTMLVAASGERMLVELKAVDGAWPLVGTAKPPGDGVEA